MRVIHIIDVTDPKTSGTLELASTKSEALQTARRIINRAKEKHGEKIIIHIYDGLRRFNTLRLE